MASRTVLLAGFAALFLTTILGATPPPRAGATVTAANARILRYLAAQDDQAARAALLVAKIRSPQDLARYIRTTPARDSPLSALSEPARKRFLATLTFGPDGLGGFGFRDLRRELTAPQIHAILALFGVAQMTPMIKADGSATTPAVTPATALATRGDSAVAKAVQAFDARQDSLSHDQSWQVFSAELRQQYVRDVQPLIRDRQMPGVVSGPDLQMLFDAAATMVFWSLDPADLADVHAVLAALRAKHAATPDNDRTLWRRERLTRQFAAAAKLQARHAFSTTFSPPSVTTLPAKPNQPYSLLAVADDANRLDYRLAKLDSRQQIIVVGHADCHFTQNAVRDLVQQHPDAWQQLTTHAIWIAPQSDTRDTADLQAWNRAIPMARIDPVYRQADWPMIDTWATPTFYFLKDGKVATKVIGWPAAGHFAALQAAMKKIGLAATAASTSSAAR